MKKLVDKNGNLIKEDTPITVRRVISENTSKRMRKLFKGVVENGTGKLAKIDSIEIGGKTGTSKIIVNGKYSDDKYYSSFIGFYPVEKPELVCYILINEPKGKYYGGLVAAPVFKEIVSRIVALNQNSGLLQPVKEMEIKSVNNTSVDDGSESIVQGLNSDVNNQSSNNLFISDDMKNIMPDLKGKTIKEALMFLNDLGVRFSISGSGVVIEQSISPGSTINSKKTCILKCSQVVTTGARIY